MMPSRCWYPMLVRCVLPYTASLLLTPLPSLLPLLRALSLTLTPLPPLLVLLRALAAPAHWGRYRSMLRNAVPGELECALYHSLLACVEVLLSQPRQGAAAARVNVCVPVVSPACWPHLLRGLTARLGPGGSGAMPPLSLRLSGGGRGSTMPSLLLSLLLFHSCGRTISGLTRLLVHMALSSAGMLLLPVLSAGRVCSCGAGSALPALMGLESAYALCGASRFTATDLSRAGPGS